MKKLMIVAAVAAMTGAAVAATNAQVYEYKLTLKTTTCKSGKVAKNTYLTTMGLYEAGEEFGYRTSASMTLAGVEWGCSCDRAFAGVWSAPGQYKAADGSDVFDGQTFWNTKTLAFLGGKYNAQDIAFTVFNRIGKKADEVELAFTIGDNTEADYPFQLICAGQGTIKDVALDPDLAGISGDCWGSYIKSAKGNVAGWLDSAIVGEVGDCWYCGTTGCDVWDFCECLGIGNPLLTIAYGTWTMKYNATASKNLEKAANRGKITNAYSGFPKSIKEALVAAKE
jgi:hypothetical protein